jgi:DNA-binding NarL/FixJ family response regulator
MWASRRVRIVTPIRVLLAEDHETVRHGLRLLIDDQDDMCVIAEAADGNLAVERAEAMRPDVVILDVSMPEMNGLAAARALKQVVPRISIIALTRHDDQSYVHELMAAGASGYVLKQSPSAHLLQAIRAAAAGDRYLDPALTKDGLRSSARAPAPVKPAITDREQEVLKLVAIGHTNKEIASHLNLSVKTVEVHKANATRKLGFKGRIDFVKYAVLQGWLRES